MDKNLFMNKNQISCWTPETEKNDDSPLNTYVRRVRQKKAFTYSSKCLADLPSLCNNKISASTSSAMNLGNSLKAKSINLGISKRLKLPQKLKKSINLNKEPYFESSVKPTINKRNNFQSKKKAVVKRKLSSTYSFDLQKAVKISKSFAKRFFLSDEC